ncbi:ABC transporter ATPase [Corynebacterium kutscheri]|uniref:ABC transporter ATPase n=1 Tax=Corynebacterium kutscheri TaxID=35755 RepID=A0A0F6R0J9_9CORY|nr:phosphatase domain-containing protein [Corynebacterium kutscheri]AKE40468.1 hypothetical protein UL82_01180 [Corynebacterium kutscheri]VEH05148.1 ABC transporter ATPase [Corynebacterium kutscheri]VEH10862.1 ABC transporter ATPase [Corynebacterium kutscheri]VEH80661.1 ABC transporter ATPase [Corynebacterium kutscheri]
MGLSDIVRSIEHAYNRYNVAKKEKAGWQRSIVPYRGFGSQDRVHVIGRILMEDPDDSLLIDFRDGALKNLSEDVQRGWRQFFTAQVEGVPVRVKVGKQIVDTLSNANGYFDVIIHDHGLATGWQQVHISAEGAQDVSTEVLIVAPETKIGVISDIDDTIMVTWLPRALLAAWNSWVKDTNSREPVDGMSQFYQEILSKYPEAPVFYLSTGAWNTYDTLVRFIDKHNFPPGPLLLTDWGPTPTGLFRSGQEHKKVQIRNLFIEYPDIQWILIGDNGQHDPLTYGEAAVDHPELVQGIAIRELTPTEHVLSHGTVSELSGTRSNAVHDVPTISGSDGYELLRLYQQHPFKDNQ